MSLKKWLNDHHLAVSCLGIIPLVALVHTFAGFLYQNEQVGKVGFPYLTMKYRFNDWVALLSRPAPKSPQVVFLADDAPSHTLDQVWDDEIEASPTLKAMKKRVWSRQIWADVLNRLADAGAKVVAFDYMFKGDDDGDAALQAAVEKHRNIVVLGSHIDDAKAAGQRIPSITGPNKTILGEPADPRVGFVNIFPEEDGVVRRMRFRTTREELAGIPPGPDSVHYESLSARAVRQAGKAANLPTGTGMHWFRYAYKGETLSETTKPVSLYSIFVPDVWAANYKSGEFFRDKIVLVGPEGNYTKDVGLSPFGLIAGPEFHLNAINAVLENEFLHPLPRWTDYVLILVGGLVAWSSVRFVPLALLRVALIPFVAAGGYTLAVLAYNHGHLIPMFSCIVAYVAVTITATAWQQLIERMEKNRMRRTFERYVSRDVVKELVDNPHSYLNTVGGARKMVTVLFSDVRGFTTITETGDAQALVKQLNEYFDAMVNIVFQNRGTLDKFIGDAVMAQWGGITTDGVKHDAIHAVRTAVQMRKKLAELNAAWIPKGMLELKFGIGVNTGEAIVGNLGCEAKMEVSLIGDPVNTASRLEGITKQYHQELIIGETVAEQVRDTFHLRTVGLNQPKGKLRPLELFTVVDDKNGKPPPAWLAVHEEGVRLFRARDFSGAIAKFKEVLEALPEDWLAEDYVRESEKLIQSPPGPEWNAVKVMESK